MIETISCKCCSSSILKPSVEFLDPARANMGIKKYREGIASLVEIWPEYANVITSDVFLINSCNKPIAFGILDFYASRSRNYHFISYLITTHNFGGQGLEYELAKAMITYTTITMQKDILFVRCYDQREADDCIKNLGGKIAHLQNRDTIIDDKIPVLNARDDKDAVLVNLIT